MWNYPADIKPTESSLSCISHDLQLTLRKLRPEVVNTTDNEKLYIKFNDLWNHKICVKLSLFLEWTYETKEKNPSNQAKYSSVCFSYTV